jgi:hypothetical protein
MIIVMSKLKDFYTIECGCDYDSLKTNVSYLSDLVMGGVMELESIRRERSDVLDHVEELTDILRGIESGDIQRDQRRRFEKRHQSFVEKYPLPKSIHLVSRDIDMSLYPVLSAYTGNDLRKQSDLLGGIREFRMELEELPQNKDRLPVLQKTLLDLNKALLYRANENCRTYKLAG